MGINKVLIERLEKELSANGFPAGQQERVTALSRVFNVPRVKANQLLHGIVTDEVLVERVACEFEVSVDWLRGLSSKKKN